MKNHLTNFERISLINQFKLLNAQEESETYKQHIAALEGGFTNFYCEIFQELSNEVSDEVLNFTNKVLEMYRSLHVFAKRNNENELLKAVSFDGFDSHSEYDYWAYTDFLINTLGRYAEISENKGESDFRSHHMTLSGYERQLAVWEKHGKPIWDKMTKEIALEILES